MRGLESMKEMTEDYAKENHLAVLVSELVELARHILDNNYFEFDGRMYRQKLGTAIGTKFPPTFAIFMATLETKF